MFANRDVRHAVGKRVTEAGQIAADVFGDTGSRTDNLPIDVDDIRYRLKEPEDNKELMA